MEGGGSSDPQSVSLDAHLIIRNIYIVKGWKYGLGVTLNGNMV